MRRGERWLLTPLVKQVPFALLVALGSALSLALPQLTVTDGNALLASIVLTLVATLWAAALTLRGYSASTLANIVPAIDFVALGMMRIATGSSTSIFTAMVVLPLVWLAAEQVRRAVVYAVLGVAVVILMPFVFDSAVTDPTRELVRLGVVLIAYGMLAVVVNQLSRLHGAQLRRSRDREAVVQAEIERAAEIQRSLLPRELGKVSGFSVAGTCLPAKSVGGDFLDWYETDGGLALTLGDVMGKGVGSALLAAAVRAVLRSARTEPDPAAAVERASQGLATDPDRAEATAGFTTLFHARLDGDVLRWVDAGHGLTVIARHDGTVERLASSSLPIGLGLEEAWRTNETRLGPDDVLVCFSDGVLDLFGGSLDTVDRVAEIARDDTRPEQVVERLITLARSVEQEDDVTVIALRRDPVPADDEAAESEPSHTGYVSAR